MSNQEGDACFPSGALSSLTWATSSYVRSLRDLSHGARTTTFRVRAYSEKLPTPTIVGKWRLSFHPVVSIWLDVDTNSRPSVIGHSRVLYRNTKMVNQIAIGRGAARKFNTSRISGGGRGIADSGVVESILRGRRRGDISKSTRFPKRNGLIAKKDVTCKRDTRINAVPSECTLSGPTKMLLSNLDIQISSFDIQDLFSECGPIINK